MNGLEGFMMILKIVYRILVIAAKVIETILESKPAQESLHIKLNGENGEKINGPNGDKK